MSFFRHEEIYQVEASCFGERGRDYGHARASRLEESPVGYSLAGCSPAEPASASPTRGYSVTIAQRVATDNLLLYENHLNSWSHSRGAPQIQPTVKACLRFFGNPTNGSWWMVQIQPAR